MSRAHAPSRPSRPGPDAVLTTAAYLVGLVLGAAIVVPGLPGDPDLGGLVPSLGQPALTIALGVVVLWIAGIGMVLMYRAL